MCQGPILARVALSGCAEPDGGSVRLDPACGLVPHHASDLQGQKFEHHCHRRLMACKTDGGPLQRSEFYPVFVEAGPSLEHDCVQT